MPTCPTPPAVPQEVLQRFRTMRDYDKAMRQYTAELCGVIPEPVDLTDVLARLSALEASVASLEAAASAPTPTPEESDTCCAVTWVAISTTPYSVVDHNVGLLVDTSVIAIRIDLPAAADWSGETIYIKDDSGNASVNNILVAPAGVDTIDDDFSLTIDSDYAGVQLQSDGSNWEIV